MRYRFWNAQVFCIHSLLCNVTTIPDWNAASSVSATNFLLPKINNIVDIRQYSSSTVFRIADYEQYCRKSETSINVSL